jgi:purine nucleosidase
LSPRSIVIDCDPGQDDAVALLMALASPDELEVLAVTTVAGNVPLDRIVGNARRIVELAGRRDVPVHAGCPRPILGPLVTAEEVHGETGLNGVMLPEPTLPLAGAHAVQAIIDIVMARPEGSVTLVPTGPHTKVALAIIEEPRIVPRLAEVVLMGGARSQGNVTASAEFNFYVDPHAARVVLDAGAPIVMFDLDVTHTVLTTGERLDRIRGLGTAVATTVAAILDFYGRHDIQRHGLAGPPLHDPCTIAWLLKPSLFTGRASHVAIETEGLCRGRSVVDWHGKSGRPANATLMVEADAPGFFDLLIERLARL